MLSVQVSKELHAGENVGSPWQRQTWGHAFLNQGQDNLGPGDIQMIATDTVFKTKIRELFWWGIAWSSASWNGIFTFFLETGLLLYLTLWKQKLWGLMLSEEEFTNKLINEHAQTELSLECVLQDCCSGWNQCVGDHQLPLQTLGRCVLPWACACGSTP